MTEEFTDLPDNPIKKLRRNLHMSQGKLGFQIGVTRQYISRLEQGEYADINAGLLRFFKEELDVDERGLRFNYAHWQTLKRRFTVRIRVVEVLEAPVGEVPFYRAFRVWRKRYFKSVADFAKSMCVNSNLISLYETGKCRSMPVQLKTALIDGGLLGEGFKTNAR